MAETKKPSEVGGDEVLSELDESLMVVPDMDPPQKMGDPASEVTEEMRDQAQLMKAKAVDALEHGNLNEALEYLTEGIIMNPTSSVLYATRASVYVKLSKPNAALRDANAALKSNPDSAKGYKARGMAKALLGLWVDSANDLHEASKLDHDDEIGSFLKKVEPNAWKIERLRRDNEQFLKEKADSERKEQEEAEMQESLSELAEGQVMVVGSNGELEEKIRAARRTSRLAVVYFTAGWCGPCRFIAPHFASLAEKHQKVAFLKVDIDQAKDAASRWHISSVPVFFFIKNGAELDKLVGADKNELHKMIQKYA